ncbi:uncharacterized protein LOC105699679 [Orussus abietinus]|uniref:uncharacterized protein LOC105699679 n=1 Tax=Orussus abietinus TaxID=222816 RepID=UPI000625EF0E|nr:uncharacterized protein LOC105699679 [Orussus abietinus]
MNLTKMCDDAHNLFFYANVCHVCKAFSKELPLKRCGNCRMIAYCGEDHQRQHWPQHKELCNVLLQMLQESGISCLLKKNQAQNAKEWSQIKTNLMLLVSIKINRRLLPYEEQMFKFPRSCVICHESESKILKDCQDCPSGSYCAAHRYNTVHSKQCTSLKLCFDLDIATALFTRETPRHVVPFHTEVAYLPNTMKDFIDLYVNENKSLPMSPECRTAYISEYLTRPLSLLYAMERLEFSAKAEITIHVIGANMIEVDGLEVWEILLHWLPSLMVLTIVLIGPELIWDSVTPNVCDCCAVEDMKIHVESCNMLYEDYVSSQWFEKPDFIIGYNTGIHECEDFTSSKDTWVASLRLLAEQNCPVVLTSYTLDESHKEHERLQAVLGESIVHTLCQFNPFSSLRPYRDYETEGVYYQNQFITIYKKLKES